MTRLRDDLVFACALFRRRPGFFLTAVATLAVGVGANVAVFSAVRAVLIDELPYREPDRVVEVWRALPGTLPQWIPTDDFEAYRTAAPAFVAMAGGQLQTGILRGQGAPESGRVVKVTPEYFSLLGTAPVIGRVLDAGDVRGDARVVVISSAIWQSQYGRSPAVIGSTLHIDREPWTVIGVMPPRFAPDAASLGSAAVGAWIPGPLTAAEIAPPGEPSRLGLAVVGRLAPDAGVDDAQRQLLAIFRSRRLAGSVWAEAGMPPPSESGEGVVVEPLGQTRTLPVRSGLLLLQGVAGLLLLVTCGNLANLFLAHATARDREFGVRVAIGATRGRLVRQLLSEAALVGVVGGAAGVLLAWTAVPVLRAQAASLLPAATVPAVRWPELALGIGAGWLTIAASALVPALLATGSGTRAVRLDSSRATAGRGTHRLRGVLMAGEVALAVIVLVGAGLLTRSFATIVSLPLGFNPASLVVARVAVPGTVFTSDDQVMSFRLRFEEELRRRIGPVDLTVGASVPFRGAVTNAQWTLVQPDREEQEPQYAHLRRVDLRYFAVLQIPVLEGRVFDDGDREGAPPVAIVNEAFVRRFAPGQRVLGRQVQRGTRVATIVGLVADTRDSRREFAPREAVYLPLAQESSPWVTIGLRTSSTAAAIRAISLAVQAVDPDVSVEATTADAAIGNLEGTRRFYLSMLGLFAALSALLAAVGIYSVLAHVTGLRSREFGIRLTLGARASQVQRQVIGRGLRPVAGGLAAGWLAAWWLGGLMEANTAFVAQLYELTPRDPWTLTAVPVGLLAVALLACWHPARRASQIDPATVLRAQ